MKNIKLLAVSALITIALLLTILPVMASDAPEGAKAGQEDSPSIRLSPVECEYPELITKVGNSLVFTLSAADPDNDAVIYSASNLPPGATFDAQTGTFAWTPGYDQAGTYPNVRFTVSDGQLTDFEEITITVTDYNRAPVLNSIGGKTAVELQPLQFTINATDPDNDALTYSALNLPAGAVFDTQTRTFAWTPAAGQQGTYAGVRFIVSDGQIADTEDITVTVTAASDNKTPSSSLFAVSSLLISPLKAEIGKRAYIHVNATNSGTAAGTYAVVLRINGQVEETRETKIAAGASVTVTFTVIKNEAGDYTVDVNGLTGAFTVLNDKRAPVLNSIGNISVNEQSLLKFILNATDIDSKVLTYSASNLPPGAAFNAQTRTFSWTPGYDQASTYPNVRFTVSDGKFTDSEDISITVINTNRAPVLNSAGNKSVAELNSLIFTVTATDPDGDALTYSASNLPSGAVFNAQTRTFSWKPAAGQKGTYTGVRFMASDGRMTATMDITITVTGGTVTTTPSSSLFKVSNLLISPLKAEVGKRAYVHVTVTNSGAVAGSYAVVLRMNGAVEETRQCTLAAGASATVTFTVIKFEAGVYLVDVNGLTGSYTVVAASTLN